MSVSRPVPRSLRKYCAERLSECRKQQWGPKSLEHKDTSSMLYSKINIPFTQARELGLDGFVSSRAPRLQRRSNAVER